MRQEIDRRQFLNFLPPMALGLAIAGPADAKPAAAPQELRPDAWWTESRDWAKQDETWMQYQLHLGYVRNSVTSQHCASLFNPGFNKCLWSVRFMDLEFSFEQPTIEVAKRMAERQVLDWLKQFMAVLEKSAFAIK